MKTTILRPQMVIYVFALSFFSSLSGGAAEQPARDGAQALFAAAEADWARQKWNDAITKFKQAADQFPDAPAALDAQCHYAECLSYVAPPEVAIVEYGKVIRRAPRSPEAHEAKCGIAALKYWLGQTQEAFDLFQQVARETKDWATLKECVGRMKHIQRLINLEKHSPGVLAKDCGPKAFAELCRLRGVELKDKELVRLLPVGPQGLTLEAMRNASRAKGMKLLGARLTGQQLQSAAKPFIAHLRNNHYCVVTGVRGSRIDFIDPHGRETYTSTNRFHVLWDGAALVPEKGVAGIQKSQLLSKAEMKKIIGGHHLHGDEDGDCAENPASGCDNGGCGGAGLPTWQVNMANYNFLIRDLVFSYSGRGPAVELRLTYSADSAIVSAFGRGWTHNYNVFLRENPNGVDVKRGGGKMDHFISRGDGTYTPPLWNYDELRKNTNNGAYTLKLKRSKETQHFDPQGRLTRIDDRNGNALTLQYDGDRLRTVTDAVGRVTTFNYNAEGLISEVIDPLGRRAGYQYDAARNLVTYLDMAGNVITYTYDQVSYMTSYTTPQGSWQVRRGTTPNFSELPYILKEVIDPLGHSRKYDTGPTIAWADDARGNRTFIFNAGAGETTLVTDPEGNSTRRTFSSGNLTQIIDPNGHTTTMAYDPRGNVISVTDNLGNIVRYQYDPRDNIVKISAPMGRTNTFVYDARDNLIQAGDARNSTTIFSLDGFGQVIAVTDPQLNSVRLAYDPFGNVTNSTGPTGLSSWYAYDAVGRVRSMTDPNGSIFNYTLDALDRVTEVRGPGTNVITYVWDCCSLASITDAAGKVAFEYDDGKRLRRFSNSSGQVIEYAYDANGNLTELTYPGGRKVLYTYDRANRMTQVVDWMGNRTRYQYDAGSNLIGVTNANDTVTRYSFDPGDRLTGQVSMQPDQSVLAAYKMAFDALGNPTNLTAVRTLLPALAATNQAARFDPDNRVTAAGAHVFSHDNNGNLVSIGGGFSATLSYDAYDRLTEAILPDTAVQYQYDALGHRVARTVNGRTRRFINDPNGPMSRVLVETDAAGAVEAYYVYGLELIARITPGGQAFTYHFDPTSSTVALTDSAGFPVNKYAYEPYGRMAKNSVEAVPNSFRFVGAYGVSDEENGLIFMRARYYLPQLGRFLNKDPLGWGGGPNVYQYVEGNPLAAIDPQGTIPAPVVGALIGAGVDLLWQIGSNILDGDPCTRWYDINWWQVGASAAVGAFFGASGPKGPLFGRARYRGTSGIFNRGDRVRLGWSWHNGRNWFTLHGGKPYTPGHWHFPWGIPGPRGPLW
jgi:RHS repeat-associated protein